MLRAVVLRIYGWLLFPAARIEKEFDYPLGKEYCGGKLNALTAIQPGETISADSTEVNSTHPTHSTATRFQRALARVSEHCIVCNFARRRQKGLVFWLVKCVEGRLCPFCRAYSSVFGRKSHERVP